MTDLKMKQLCARAMGLRVATAKTWARYAARRDQCWVHVERCRDGSLYEYDPLTNDAQLMGLVKRFPDVCLPSMLQHVHGAANVPEAVERALELNRVAVRAVAVMWASR